MCPCSEIENEGIITVKVQNKRIINFSWNAKEVKNSRFLKSKMKQKLFYLQHKS